MSVMIDGYKFDLYKSGRSWCARIIGITETCVEARTKKEIAEKMTEMAAKISALKFQSVPRAEVEK
jgi:hypothetical protein